MFRCGYNHYHNRAGVALPNTQRLIAEQIRPTAPRAVWNLAYETLTHAELDLNTAVTNTEVPLGKRDLQISQSLREKTLGATRCGASVAKFLTGASDADGEPPRIVIESMPIVMATQIEVAVLFGAESTGFTKLHWVTKLKILEGDTFQLSMP